MTQTVQRPVIERLLQQARSGARPAAVPCAPANDTGGDPVNWGLSSVAGRGLFATHAFAAGETIVCSPAHYVRTETLDRYVSPYAFAVDRPGADATSEDGLRFALVFGPISLSNHSDEPNASVTFIRTMERGLEARVTALRAIAAGEEIFICYPDRKRYQPAGWF